MFNCKLFLGRVTTHIAHICKSHMPTHKPKFAKECNFCHRSKLINIFKLHRTTLCGKTAKPILTYLTSITL